MSDAATKLAKGLKKHPRAGLEAVRLELKWKVNLYKQKIKQFETMISIMEDSIGDIQLQISELDNGTE